jgi:hypothetical protein
VILTSCRDYVQQKQVLCALLPLLSWGGVGVLSCFKCDIQKLFCRVLCRIWGLGLNIKLPTGWLLSRMQAGKSYSRIMESYIPLQSNLEIGLTLSFVQLPEVGDGAGNEETNSDSIIPGECCLRITISLCPLKVYAY